MPQYLEPEVRYSEAVVHGDTVYLAGQVPETLDGDIGVQTREVCAAIDRGLALAGSDKRKLLSATVYLRDMADYAGMNAVWDAWLAPGPGPARACVRAEMADPAYRVEIMVVAAR
ncbi:enamine deaminase RidA (YjgF/YER057c/UK114 family) [Plasticicumulans lactativorans]|uniref:Enamine deaminase RidA (YjgF/YER057c/UK114 family) n=1 Tax=Plasticicumulans lactativorans TaxID=1133106 RepID=A0A4V2SBW2_9GAMM|nr:RidA family protein [Plasticicumulans lactativorans]TCO76530.1 enamine deaminase RidA (YjgF/YER057c/UK114 family) [Plasticicumulans lactativorans]